MGQCYAKDNIDKHRSRNRYIESIKSLDQEKLEAEVRATGEKTQTKSLSSQTNKTNENEKQKVLTSKIETMQHNGNCLKRLQVQRDKQHSVNFVQKTRSNTLISLPGNSENIAAKNEEKVTTNQKLVKVINTNVHLPTENLQLESSIVDNLAAEEYEYKPTEENYRIKRENYAKMKKSSDHFKKRSSLTMFINNYQIEQAKDIKCPPKKGYRTRKSVVKFYRRIVNGMNYDIPESDIHLYNDCFAVYLDKESNKVYNHDPNSDENAMNSRTIDLTSNLTDKKYLEISCMSFIPIGEDSM